MIYTHKTLGVLPSGVSFQIGDVTYPGNWLRTASPEELASIDVTATPFVPEPPAPARQPTSNDVRTETARRLIELFKARDADHLAILISNAVREQGRLQAILSGVPGLVEKREWTEEEAARARYLYSADAAMEAIRQAGNLMEDYPPEDYQDDKRWP